MKKRSGFKSGLAILAPLGLPVFQLMQQEERAVPLIRGAAAEIKNLAPDEQQNRMMFGFRLFRLSHKYCRAIVAEGAYRHDLQGNPVEPVEDDARAAAARNIAQLKAATKAKRKAASVAAKQLPKRPILKLKQPQASA